MPNLHDMSVDGRKPWWVRVVDGDALAAVKFLAAMVRDGCRRRGWNAKLEFWQRGLAGELEFARYLATQRTVSFAGPLPYCGPADRTPDDFVMWLPPRSKLKVDIHTADQDSLRTYGNIPYPAPRLMRWRKRDVKPDDYVIGASALIGQHGEGRQKVLSRITLAYWGATTGQRLMEFTKGKRAIKGHPAFHTIPLDEFKEETLRELLTHAHQPEPRPAG